LHGLLLFYQPAWIRETVGGGQNEGWNVLEVEMREILVEERRK
jgi:hypothetical protein